jgi:hypothetical protein
MKKNKLTGIVAVICASVVLLSSCVSSKKYHASQDALSKMRADSAAMAQQSAALNQNIATLEQKNTMLNRSLDSMNSGYAGLQKSYTFYQEYFNKQQTTAAQIKDELKNSLGSSGITDQDLQQMEGKIYINLAEKGLFAGNSAVLTSKGKELINNLGQVIKSHDDIEVSVADLSANTNSYYAMNGDPAGATTTMTNDNITTKTYTTTSKQKKSGGNMDKPSTGNTDQTNADMDQTNAATDKSMNNKGSMHTNKKTYQTNTDNTRVAYKAPHTKKTNMHVMSAESKSITYSNGNSKKLSSAKISRSTVWSRQNAVAGLLLKNGVPHVNVVSENELSTDKINSGKQKGVQVILSPDMKIFYKNINNGQPTHSIGINQ